MNSTVKIDPTGDFTRNKERGGEGERRKRRVGRKYYYLVNSK